jgi:pyruvate formate-lyase activating enzyme-like uncharacterized protein
VVLLKRKRKVKTLTSLPGNDLRPERFCWVCTAPLRDVLYVTTTGAFRCAYCRRPDDRRSKAALYKN